MNLDLLRSKIHTRTSYSYLLVISYHSFINLCFGFVIYVHVLVIIVYSYILNKSQTLHGVIIIFIPYVLLIAKRHYPCLIDRFHSRDRWPQWGGETIRNI